MFECLLRCWCHIVCCIHCTVQLVIYCHLLRLLHSKRMLYYLLHLLQSILYDLLHLLYNMLCHIISAAQHVISSVVQYIICCTVCYIRNITSVVRYILHNLLYLLLNIVTVWCTVCAVSVALLVSVCVVSSSQPSLSPSHSFRYLLSWNACTPPFILKSCSWVQLSSLNFSYRPLGIFSSSTTQIVRLKCLSFF
jgi:hypothetical protein